MPANMSTPSILSPLKRTVMDSLSHDTDSASSERDSKRRKLRKGTTSCWYCKKRKIKCTFDATSETVCIACRRRGTTCVSQDHPEEETTISHGDNSLDGRIQRVEALLEQLLELGRNVEKNVALAGHREPFRTQTGYVSPTSDCQLHELQTSSLENPATQANSTSSTDPMRGMTDECRELSKGLIKVFPCQEDIDSFCKSDYIATFYCHQMLTKSVDRPEQEAIDFVNELAKIPNPETTHPVVVAKKMMIFALLLMYHRSHSNNALKEQGPVIMDRLVEAAVRFISMDDRGFGCIEGVECIILEGIYHCNRGNLRRAWLAFRKAMVIAQMLRMDLPKPPAIISLDPNTKLEPRYMWYRIVFMDSFVSLMLGLPHGGQETNMENEVPGETPICRLERYHTLMARQIIDRNKCDSSLQNLDVTKAIDKKLLEVARSMPNEFWTPPDYTNLQPSTKEDFFQTMQLCNQLHHLNLVHLLHLPFLFSDEEKSRTADFFALMAGMTILLAHIDGHKLKADDWRAHQRNGDRALVEQLLSAMDRVGTRIDDSLTLESAENLRKLLEVEGDAARGANQCVQDTVHCLEKGSADLQLSIPYFGIIRIGEQGITKNVPRNPDPPQYLSSEMHQSIQAANHPLLAAGMSNAMYQYSRPDNVGHLPEPNPLDIRDVTVQSGHTGARPHYQSMNFPGLAATVDDWAFQGVDAAFFDSLIRGTSVWEPGLPGNL